MNNLNYKPFILCLHFLSLPAVSFGALSTAQELLEIKKELVQLKTKVAQFNPGPGVPTPSIDQYFKTGACTALTTQPTAASCGALTCYTVSSFVDAKATSLIGYNLSATKSSADATNKDGGIWLCDSSISLLSAINQCTNIGGNKRDGSNGVLFKIPVGTASTAKVVALSMNSLGTLSAASALSGISVCTEVATVAISP